MGDTGLYSARMTFADAGIWRADVDVAPPGAASRTVKGFFRVSERSFTPAIGSDAPRSDTKTAGDVSSLAEITSSPDPDPALYQLSVSDAVTSGKPTVIAFTHPAFCSTATCGPNYRWCANSKPPTPSRPTSSTSRYMRTRTRSRAIYATPSARLPSMTGGCRMSRGHSS